MTLQELASPQAERAEQAPAKRDSGVKLPVIVLLAALGLAAMWAYIMLVLLPYTRSVGIHYGAATVHYSDLYAPWLAGRELLQHGRDPYGADITREIQLGVYGQVIDPASGIDQVAFAYPVHLILVLTPIFWLSFSTLQLVFAPLALVATVAALLLWMAGLGLHFSRSNNVALILLALASVGFVNGVIVMQISLFLALLLAAAVFALSRGHYPLAGVLMAICTVKPQLAGPLLAGMIV